MIKAVIFDLNGIFLKSPKLSDRFEKDFNVSNSVFLPILDKILDAVRRPNAGPAYSYWKPVLDDWNIRLSELEFLDYWFKYEVLSDEMVDFSKFLREKGIKVFVLSNNFKERAEYYGRYAWMHEAMDKVYFSWQTGFVKPDPKAWQLVLTENNLKPEECIYFDDNQKNLDSAQSVGIKSYLFTYEAEAKRILLEQLKLS